MPWINAHRGSGQVVKVVSGEVNWSTRELEMLIPDYNAKLIFKREGGRTKLFRKNRQKIDPDKPATLNVSGSVYRSAHYLADHILVGHVGPDEDREIKDLRFVHI